MGSLLYIQDNLSPLYRSLRRVHRRVGVVDNFVSSVEQLDRS